MTLQAELVNERLLHPRTLAHHRPILHRQGQLNQDFGPTATPTFSTESTLLGQLASLLSGREGMHDLIATIDLYGRVDIGTSVVMAP